MDIAIIGMAARLPDAENIEQFYENLIKGVNSIKSPSEKRIRDSFVDPEEKYQKGGYIDDVDYFDHKFFNISFQEARIMDPNQRLALEVVYETIENAGYNIDVLNNSKTAVWVTETPMSYKTFIFEEDPTLITGNLSSMIAGRISRFFNLRGGAMTLGSSCSSSLVALHYACNELKLDQIDFAVVCGLRLFLTPPRVVHEDMGLISRTDQVCSFSENSSGTIFGEAICSVLLKPLSKALNDGDIIHGIIKGSAVNQDAALSGSITAPDSFAQSQVIKMAWENARVDPESIGLIEAHGTATKLGDPIEIEGLDQAFSQFTSKKKFSALTAVKTYIGHADCASGISGLIKTIISLKYKKIFPLLNFTKPNPFIDFENSALYPVTQTTDWITDDKRRAGVSSFGLAGTNCHVILEEGVKLTDLISNDTSGPYLIIITAKDETALKSNAIALLDYISTHDVLIEDISHTLNLGRKHYDFRIVLTVKDKQDLINKLSHPTSLINKTAKQRKIVFIFPDQQQAFNKQIADLNKYSSFFAALYQQTLNHLSGSINNVNEDVLQSFLFQYCFSLLLDSKDIDKVYCGDGLGQITCSVLSEEITLGEAAKLLENYSMSEKVDVSERCQRLIDGFKSDDVIFIELGGEGNISSTIASLKTSNDKFDVPKTGTSRPEMIGFIRQLYEVFYPLIFNRFNLLFGGCKIELPAYKFNKIRCWIGNTAQAVQDYQLRFDNELKDRIAGNRTPTSDIITSPEPPVYFQNWSDTEVKITNIWQEVLKTETLKLTDDFFEIGGHSLNGNQVANKIDAKFKVKFDLEDLFDCGTISASAALVDERLQLIQSLQSAIDIIPVPVQENYEVSHAQQRLWILNEIGIDIQKAYNISWTYYHEATLDLHAFEQAIDFIIKRHESLRTSFKLIDNILKQQVHLDFEARNNIQILNIEGSNDEIEFIDNYISALMDHHFDLTTPSQFVIKIVRVNSDMFILVFIIHHIIFDWWSKNILTREVMECYNLFKNKVVPSIPSLKFQYKDFAAWQNRLLSSEQTALVATYWHKLYQDGIPSLELPADFARPILKTYNGRRLNFFVKKELGSALKELNNSNDSTLFMSLLTMVSTLLSRYSGQSEFSVGASVAGRNHTDLENQIGFYVNTLPLKIVVPEAADLGQFLNTVKKMTIESFANQLYPFDLLVADLNLKHDRSRHPIFDVMVNVFYESGFDVEHISDNATNDPGAYESQSIMATKFDFTFNFFEQAGAISFNIEYNSDIYSSDRIKRMGYHLINLMIAFTHDIRQSVSTVNFLSSEEKLQLITGFNVQETFSASNDNFIQQFEKQIARFPDNIAIQYKGTALSYHQLNKKANQLSSYLINEIRLKNNDLVAIHLQRSEWTIIAIIAILKAGAGYLPIDINYPEQRKLYILKDSGAVCILTDDDSNDRMPVTEIEMVNLSRIDRKLLSQNTENPGVPSSQHDVAYVIYTSGSTGSPKGCVIENNSLLNYVEWACRYYFNDTSFGHLGFFTSLSFDFTVTSIFCPLLTGKSVIVFEEEMALDEILRHVFSHDTAIDAVKLTPAHILILNELNISNTNVRLVIVGGEALTTRHVEILKRIDKNITIINEYGPTEATVGCIVKNVQSSEEYIVIGKPIHNAKIFVLDKFFNLQPIGINGEICIGGAVLARGYLNDPELTASRFIANQHIPGERLYLSGDRGKWLANGDVDYVGRIDTQIKIRGNRVEPSEVQRTMEGYVGISAAVVLLKGDGDNKYLVGYYKGAESTSQTDLRVYLSKIIPGYMMPAYLVRMADFPLTSNGKLSYDDFPDPVLIGVGESNIYVGSRNSLQQMLINTWEKVLGRKGIGITDDFFDFGGDSLKAILLSGQLPRLGYEMSIQDLYKNPTIELLSSVIRTRNIHEFDQVDQKPVSGAVPLTPIQHWFFSNNPGRHHYNQSVLLYSPTGYKSELVIEVLRMLQTHHDALRMTFCFTNVDDLSQIEQYNHDIDFPVYLEEYDLRGQLNWQKQLEVHGRVLQANINIEEGPLLRAAIFRINEGDRLLLAIHHLVIDGISWRILFEDFSRLYQQLVEGEDLILPHKTKSFQSWAMKLAEYSNSPAFLNLQRPYWEEIERKGINSLVLNKQATENLVKDSAYIGLELDEGRTEILLTRLNRFYGAEINDILLTALGLSISSAFGVEQVLVALEGHGREPIFENFDISRTIGWFTSLYPVLLEVPDGSPLSQQIRGVSEMLKQIPDKGVGYGLLRYLTKTQNNDTPRLDSRPSIIFNYLGQMDADLDNSSLQMSDEAHGETEEDERSRDFLIDINSVVLGRKLKVSITYNKLFFSHEIMEKLRAAYNHILYSIIDQADANQVQIEQDLPKEITAFISGDDITTLWLEIKSTANTNEEMISGLQKICAQIFDKNVINRHENLLELSYGKGISIVLLHDLYKILDPKFTMSDVFNAPTIKELVERIQGDKFVVDNGLVRLNEISESKTTMFMIPPAIGIPDLYLPVAKVLDRTFNCYGFLFNGYDLEGDLCESLDYQLEYYVKSIVDIEAGDTIMLFSYSWSVSFAFELTKKLENAGKTVKLVMIDMCIDHKLYQTSHQWELDEYDRTFEINLEDMPDEYRKKVKKIFMNNNRNFLNYQTTGVVNADILAIEGTNNIEQVGMIVWKDFTRGSFTHKVLQADHWNILGDKQLLSLSADIERFCKKNEYSTTEMHHALTHQSNVGL